MNTIWLKIVGVVVAIVIMLMIYSKLSNIEHDTSSITGRNAAPPERVEPQKTLGDTLREDDKRLRAEPNIVESNAPAGAELPKFRKLAEEEEAGASQLFELAITQRKIGRMPGMHYGAMVQYCRQIIEKYPGSEYAYKAKRMLADIPESDRERYHITADEMDLNK